MSFQMSLGLTVNATSSLELAAGHSPSGLPDGPTIAPCGQVAPPVNLSARRAKEEGLLTSGTYGQRSFGSSASVALRQSLVSKLHQRMDSDGGILFRLTWKERVTPAGQTIYALRGLQQSPKSQLTLLMNLLEKHLRSCSEMYPVVRPIFVSAFTGWGTPKVQNANAPGEHGQGGQDLQTVSSWATPAARDYRSPLATEKHHQQRAERPNGKPLSEQTHTLLDPGTTPSGSPAPTEKRGQLNAAFSRWLQGYPVEWDIAAILAHRQRKTRQKGG